MTSGECKFRLIVSCDCIGGQLESEDRMAIRAVLYGVVDHELPVMVILVTVGAEPELRS